MSAETTLVQLGWQPFFQQQLNMQEWEELRPVRVTGVHRSGLEVLPEQPRVPWPGNRDDVTVGDWLLLSAQGKPIRCLDRLSLFSRKAAGSAIAEQLIAANIDTVFIVCAMDDDFNMARIERYLVLAHEAGVSPVVVLSKADRCSDAAGYLGRTQRLDSTLNVVPVNALDAESVTALKPWLGEGQTVALLGSSGVGKSTLVNTLMGSVVQHTGGVRLDDSKGRHTTTSRSMHVLPSGGLLLDTPGMRELQLAGAISGVQDVFHDVTELAALCRFTNCQHKSEPGCAVIAAIESGVLDERRLRSFYKLDREQRLNAATLAEKRARDRGRGKLYKTAQAAARQGKKGAPG